MHGREPSVCSQWATTTYRSKSRIGIDQARKTEKLTFGQILLQEVPTKELNPPNDATLETAEIGTNEERRLKKRMACGGDSGILLSVDTPFVFCLICISTLIRLRMGACLMLQSFGTLLV